MRFYVCALDILRSNEEEIPRAVIEYAETENVEVSSKYPEGRRFTGEIERFEYDFSREELEDERLEIEKVAMELSDVWDLEQSDELPWVDRRYFIEYIDLKKKMEKIKREMEDISGLLLDEMNKEGLRLFSMPGAVFSLTKTGRLSITLKNK